MKSFISLSHKRASALLTVVFLTAVMAILTASVLSYTGSEKRGNERNRLTLRAKNMAENISIYAAEQLTTKLYRLGTAPVMKFPWSGDSTNRVYMPPDSVLNTAFTSSATGMELRAGIETASAYALVSDTSNPNYGLQVSTATVPIIAKATATHPALGSITSYVQQDMQLALTPLFQFGMFYNMDMEFYPSQTFTVAGPVHTNNRLIAHPDGSSTITISFLNRTTAAAGIYWNTAMKAKPRGANGVESLPTEGNGNVSFTPASGGTPVTLKESSKWRDHMYKTTSETTTTLSQFKTFATNTYGGNLRTNVHGVTKLELPGVGTYSETDDPSTAEDDRNNGRQIIEPPNPKKWNGSTWAVDTDDADTKESKISRKAGLYIVVNPDDDVLPRSFTLPDDTVKYILPRSYRAWLNITETDSSHTLTEIVLPGQPTYGYDAGTDGSLGTSDDVMYRNYLPNRFDTTTVCGDSTGNQVLRIPQGSFGMGTGYQTNGALAVAETSITVDSGSGPILAGESITIGAHQYFVTSDLAANVVKIASPGLRAAVADNTVVTVNPMDSRGTGAGHLINNGAGYAIGATSLTLDTGTGTILPGNTVNIGAHKYLVSSALVTNVITIAAPGLRAAVANNAAVSIDAASGTVGTGEGYFINNAAGYAVGDTSLALDTGAGTILPGNLLVIGAQRYVVASALTGGIVTICSPGLVEAVADNTLVIVDPFENSGYSTSTVSPNFATNSGSTFPPDDIAAAPFAYFPADAYFFDLRRANGNRGVISTSGTTGIYRRDLVNYVPRAIAKIDFDMSRFKMMVDRVISGAEESNVYDVRAPNAAGAAWASSIFNASGVRADHGLGMGASFDVFPSSASVATRTRQDPFQLYYAPANPADAATVTAIMTDPMAYVVPSTALYHGSAACAWYDGIAVYIHSVDAEMRAQTSNVPNRSDSGVRLVNGRGSVVSLATATKTGCTIVTNDAVYIIGHYNADGTIDATDTDTGTGNPNYYGGYSARYPDGASEKLCAVMGDAFTALAQPLWTNSTSGQTSGWNDALSALPVVASSVNWRSASPLAGNDDGVRTGANGPRAGSLPTQSYPGTLGAQNSIRLPAVNTEMSTALLMGIVPSNHNPTGLTDFGHAPPGATAGTYLANGVNSGGANNFPRLGDNWSGDGLYIRGSIVALFESRVAMEPFTNSRNYRAPGRYWGLHYNFSTPNHDIPLEPIVLSNTRIGFRELTAAEYATKKAAIEALP